MFEIAVGDWQIHCVASALIERYAWFVIKPMAGMRGIFVVTVRKEGHRDAINRICDAYALPRAVSRAANRDRMEAADRVAGQDAKEQESMDANESP